ncbi:MAG: ABC transporter substrate-binding protein, partial [Ilumatobacter sp.]
IDNAELNLERIAALAPDLILAREIYLNDGEAEQLGQIAPILPIAGDGSWRDDLEQLAGWLERSDLLDDALEDYDTALDDVRTRHADRLSTPIAIVEYYPADDTFYAGGVDDFQLQANTLGELGGTLVPFLADRSYFDEPFSIENLGEIADAGAILLVSNSQEDRDLLAANPIWQQLPAVVAGSVVVTDTRTNQGSVYAATESIHSSTSSTTR